MKLFATTMLFTVLCASPATSTATSLLRRNLAAHSPQDNTNLPDLNLEQVGSLLTEEQDFFAKLFSDLSLSINGMSHSMPPSPPPERLCKTAYVYCGSGVSQCDLYGGWEININAINFDNRFELNCEIRLGSGVCNADWEIDVTDILIGAFQMTPNRIASTLFDTGLGAQYFTLELLNNNSRRLNLSLPDTVDSVGSQAESQPDVPVGALFHSAGWNPSNYDISIGGTYDFMSVHATVCPCYISKQGCFDGPDPLRGPPPFLNDGHTDGEDPPATTKETSDNESPVPPIPEPPLIVITPSSTTVLGPSASPAAPGLSPQDSLETSVEAISDPIDDAENGPNAGLIGGLVAGGLAAVAIVVVVVVLRNKNSSNDTVDSS